MRKLRHGGIINLLKVTCLICSWSFWFLQQNSYPIYWNPSWNGLNNKMLLFTLEFTHCLPQSSLPFGYLENNKVSQVKNITFFKVGSFAYSVNIYWVLTVYQDVFCLGNVGIKVPIEKSTFKDVMSADCSLDYVLWSLSPKHEGLDSEL